MADNDIIIYTTDDGLSQFTLRELGQQLWLNQLELAELYQTSKQNISKHIKAILAENELDEASVVNFQLTTATDGKRYNTQIYALPMILAIGYRVRSARGTQFQQWATRTLTEYIQKGFVLDEERLKNPEQITFCLHEQHRIGNHISESQRKFAQYGANKFSWYRCGKKRCNRGEKLFE